jgi:hypothetical protein
MNLLVNIHNNSFKQGKKLVGFFSCLTNFSHRVLVRLSGYYV